MRWHYLLAICICLSGPVRASHTSAHPLNQEQWQEVMQNVTLLDEAVLIPSLLPIIMRNKHALQLSRMQLERLYEWRAEHYGNMVNLMNQVIEMKVQFGIEALSTDVKATHLMELQQQLQAKQRELLRIRLSCREIVIQTFSEEQWENLEFIAADDPRLASLFSQSHDIYGAHRH